MKESEAEEEIQKDQQVDQPIKEVPAEVPQVGEAAAKSVSDKSLPDEGLEREIEVGKAGSSPSTPREKRSDLGEVLPVEKKESEAEEDTQKDQQVDQPIKEVPAEVPQVGEAAPKSVSDKSLPDEGLEREIEVGKAGSSPSTPREKRSDSVDVLPAEQKETAPSRSAGDPPLAAGLCGPPRRPSGKPAVDGQASEADTDVPDTERSAGLAASARHSPTPRQPHGAPTRAAVRAREGEADAPAAAPCDEGSTAGQQQQALVTRVDEQPLVTRVDEQPLVTLEDEQPLVTLEDEQPLVTLEDEQPLVT
eukprot:Selendium_serpulae@DN6322_c0_g1_i1.p2